MGGDHIRNVVSAVPDWIPIISTRNSLPDRYLSFAADHMLTITPRSKSNSSMSRRLSWNRKYHRTAWLMIEAGNRWPRYSNFAFSIPDILPNRAANAIMPRRCMRYAGSDASFTCEKLLLAGDQRCAARCLHGIQCDGTPFD